MFVCIEISVCFVAGTVPPRVSVRCAYVAVSVLVCGYGILGVVASTGQSAHTF
jgi:hypothetical protein